MVEPLVHMRGISKAYPGVVALRDVDFAMARGEVRALLGKNGAGKSTLVKILAGVERPDEGAIVMDGKAVVLRTPMDGIRAGIATVHQELSVVPELSIAENVFLGRWPKQGGRIDWRRMQREAHDALAVLGLYLDPRQPVARLSVAERQLVEIARALSQGARLLILDEPTSSLVAQEAETLIRVVRQLAEQGTSIVYISHRMDEIRKVAQSVTIMRDGRHIATAPVADVSNRQIVEMLLGGAQGEGGAPRLAGASGVRRPLLAIQGLHVAPRIQDASFEIRAGEVLGIAGVLGSGRTELLQAIAGLRATQGGSMTLDGSAFRPASLREARANGIFMTPEDRRGEGAVMMLGIDENLVMASWRSVSRGGVIDRVAMRAKVAASIRALGIKLAHPGEPLGNLSGGNQQKVVIGKALNAAPRILLLDEPTRGVDIGAKRQIYQLMRDAAADGLAVVFVSGEIEEFCEVCDRVLILRGGSITGAVEGPAIRTETLTELTTGEQGVH
ncbi:sugar ABC transporter ATP-binding protein [Shinella sp. 838]|jgi:simple sugar transport system ATP-binding protein|uniref:sugar ABC transporter ATP-binding protein n=1 Tax=unclassified Shinella TaxID=2643062 RepID=UPI000409EF17|nr:MULTISPECIES: sugar ABC transporter ATP-binding protein [unclassified Shinella]MCA0340514.1 sugar ABC transporter ATP-binding protein [Pseudomonadota bacterium]MDG4673620.1 sugar ABC transporter ATP-binding protein [Shinella sp. 838]